MTALIVLQGNTFINVFMGSTLRFINMKIKTKAKFDTLDLHGADSMSGSAGVSAEERSPVQSNYNLNIQNIKTNLK